MKLFLDANILVSVLNKEYPVYSYSARLLSLADHRGYSLYTSPICLAIAFYFAEKKYRSETARRKIAELCAHLTIAENTEAGVKKALNDKAVNNFEDGLKYYAALDHGCTCIITEDRNDFYFSEIEVLTCQDFFNKYLLN